MGKNIKIRWGWLKFMYIYTLVGAGTHGLGIILMPDFTRSMFLVPISTQLLMGLQAASIWRLLFYPFWVFDHL